MTTMYVHASVHTESIGTGLRVTICEKGRKIQCEGRTLSLTPTEYRLCATFFQRWQKRNREPIMRQDELTLLAYLSTREIQTRVSLSSLQLLRKHICNLNGKILAFQLQIKAFENGYILLQTNLE